MAKKTVLQKAKEKLWELCKAIIRIQYGNTCYTCGSGDLEGKNWQTGHFITSSVCSAELRYDLLNLRPQCFSCNINKSGNWPAFESNLIRDHGIKYVKDLKSRNHKTKGGQFDILWYRDKIEEYTAILSELQKTH